MDGGFNAMAHPPMQHSIVHARAPAVPWDHEAKDRGGQQLRIVSLDIVITAFKGRCVFNR